jgi:SAM-dependent methyltransferase
MGKEPGQGPDSFIDQRRYWDGNLDTRNLSAGAEAPPDLDEEIAFLESPEYLYGLEEMGDLEGRIVLEVGCGMGVNALALARRGARVVALDLSAERLRRLMDWARREGLADRVWPVQGAIEAAPLAAGAVHRAFTKSVLIHTRLERAAAEIARVLADDGLAVFIEPSRFNPFAWIYRRFFGPAIWREIAAYFDARRWEIVARPFGALNRRPFFFVGFLGFYWQFARRDLGRFRRAVAFTGRLDSAFFRLCPPLKGLCWMDVATAEKRGARGRSSPERTERSSG